MALERVPKIKAGPQDFVVKEIASLPISERGEFGVYLLNKRGYNTIELLLEISRRLKVPFSDLSYGGRKDRHATTSQYICIKGRRKFNLVQKGYSLKYAGSMDRPMGPDLISANEFEITVRNIDKQAKEGICEQLALIDSFGYPNYFDDQRFGSLDSKCGFWAEKVLKGQLNGALKAYLASVYREDKKDEKEAKAFYFEHWKDWQACYRRAATESEREIFSLLIKRPHAYPQALKGIPKYEVSLFVGAYQAYLWNEILRRLIALNFTGALKRYPGIVGDYLFYLSPDQDEFARISNLVMPLPGSKPDHKDKLPAELYDKVLEENGIKKQMFNKVKIRSVFFKSVNRCVMVRPQGLNFSFQSDDRYAGSLKLYLKFRLGRGSYATMLLKRILACA